MTAFNHNISFLMCLMMSFEKQDVENQANSNPLNSMESLPIETIWTLCAYLIDSNLH